MPSKKRNLVFVWPFAPSDTGLNKDTNLLKIIAMITMVCDHAGKIFFPTYPIMRIIGRIAFPLYAYCIACGCVRTKDFRRYITRLVLLALVSQPIYAVSLNHTTNAMFSIPFHESPVRCIFNFYVHSWNHPSIMLTLILGVITIWTIRERNIVLTAAMLLFAWLAQNSIDYGMRGIGLILLFYLTIEHWWISLPVISIYMLWWALQGRGYTLFGYRFGIQIFAMFALPVIYIRTSLRPKVHKYAFYAFYPAHLLLIHLITIINP